MKCSAIESPSHSAKFPSQSLVAPVFQFPQSPPDPMTQTPLAKGPDIRIHGRQSMTPQVGFSLSDGPTLPTNHGSDAAN
jgi:hypothetical protein